MVTTKYLTKFQSPRDITWAKIIGPERNVNLICNSSLYTQIPKIKSISPSIVKKVVTTKYLAKFQSPRDITWPKIIGPERNVNLICNSSLYTQISKIKSISPSIVKKVVTTKYLTKFQSPRAIFKFTTSVVIATDPIA